MLQIRNPRVDELVSRLATLKGRSKTEVVLAALEREWALAQQATELEARLKPLQDFVAAHPKTGLAADKAFFDSLYDEP
jgi:antitoxin VapB